MLIGLAAALALLGGWVALSLGGADVPVSGPIGGLFGFGIVVFGVIVQFGGRCPRCSRRIVPRSRLQVPRRCPRCGVGFGGA